MTRDEVIDRLKPHEADLREEGICALYLFGSTARDEAEASSDVDLLFELGDASRFSLLTQAGVQIKLSELLGRKVDLVDRHCLRPRVRQRVDPDLVRIF
jgi:uncharacterized protein